MVVKQILMTKFKKKQEKFSSSPSYRYAAYKKFQRMFLQLVLSVIPCEQNQWNSCNPKIKLRKLAGRRKPRELNKKPKKDINFPKFTKITRSSSTKLTQNSIQLNRKDATTNKTTNLSLSNPRLL